MNFILTIFMRSVNIFPMNTFAAQVPAENFPSVQGFVLADELELRSQLMASRRKRVRTRAHLLAVAARELERVGYESLTVEHMAQAAGMTRATFYQYYSSRAHITAGLLGKYWALMRARRPIGSTKRSLRESIHRTNSYSVMLASMNPRLLAAKETLSREDPKTAARMAHVNRIWAKRILRDLIRRGLAKPEGDDLPYLRMKARAVINMSDSLLSDVYRMADWDGRDGPLDLELVIKVMDDFWLDGLYSTQRLVPR